MTYGNSIRVHTFSDDDVNTYRKNQQKHICGYFKTPKILLLKEQMGQENVDDLSENDFDFYYFSDTNY